MRVIISTLALLAILSAACRHTVKSPDREAVVRVRVATIVRDTFSLPVHTSGTLVTMEEMKLSFKTGGIVERIFVREGDKVRKGESLAALNLVEIRANEEQAGIAYAKALRDYRRADTLLNQGALSLEKQQNAETALNIAGRSLEIARFNLAHSRIEAPGDGIIMKQFVKESELVSPGYPVFLFGASGNFWKIEAGLTDRDMIKINAGDSADVLFDTYPGVRFRAVVDQVGEMADPYTGTYKAELALKGEGYRLAPGFLAAVDIYPSGKQYYKMVPVRSIVGADGLEGFVFTVTGSGEVRKLRVGIAVVRGSMVAVTGIADSVDEIVCDGAAYLHDGDTVKVAGHMGE